MIRIMLGKSLRSSALACVLFLLLLLPTAVSAQNRISATATANRETLTVGDPVEISIFVQHPAGSIATLAVKDWGDFELLNQSDVAQLPSGSKLQINVTLWKPGSYELPPLTIRIINDAGKRETAVTNPLTLTVTSVLTDGDRTLRDIRPQATLPQTPFYWVWLLLVVGLIAGGTAVWQKRRMKPMPTVPIATAQEDAMAALDALGEPPPEEWGIFTTAVLHILRHFLQQITTLPIHYRTTSELSNMLPQTSLLPAQQAEISTLLQEIDALRFAPPPHHSPAMLIESSRQFILQTSQEPLH